MNSSQHAVDPLHHYAISELGTSHWQHALYLEYIKKGGARLVLEPHTLSPGFTPPQDKVLKEYFTDFEGFPIDKTGVSFVNFSIKEHERPAGHGGLAVVAAQRVLHRDDHAKRSGPFWKHAVFVSAGPTSPAPILLNEHVLNDAAQLMAHELSRQEAGGELILASEYDQFQNAETRAKERDVLLAHLRRFDKLPEPASVAPTTFFRTKRSKAAPRGVLYILWDSEPASWAQILRHAARLATILYWSDFPWLSVEVQSEDRPRESSSLPGWVIRFVPHEMNVRNGSAKRVDLSKLFTTDAQGKEESLWQLASRLFPLLDCALEKQPETPHEGTTDPLSIPVRATSERGGQTLIGGVRPSSSSKEPSTDRLQQDDATRPIHVFAQATEYIEPTSSGASAPASLPLSSSHATHQIPVLSAELRPPEIGTDQRWEKPALPVAPMMSDPLRAHRAPESPPLLASPAQTPLPPAATTEFEAQLVPPRAHATWSHVLLGIWGLVVFAGATASMVSTVRNTTRGTFASKESVDAPGLPGSQPASGVSHPATRLDRPAQPSSSKTCDPMPPCVCAATPASPPPSTSQSSNRSSKSSSSSSSSKPSARSSAPPTGTLPPTSPNSRSGSPVDNVPAAPPSNKASAEPPETGQAPYPQT